MNSHEALMMQPKTRIQWTPPPAWHRPILHGSAYLDTNLAIRIEWDDMAEPDSIINISDRRGLAYFIIETPAPGPGS